MQRLLKRAVLPEFLVKVAAVAVAAEALRCDTFTINSGFYQSHGVVARDTAVSVAARLAPLTPIMPRPPNTYVNLINSLRSQYLKRTRPRMISYPSISTPQLLSLITILS
jgi:hypothetical protein